MVTLQIDEADLPAGPLDAAAEFYATWLPRARAHLPPRNGEGDHAQHGGGELPGREFPSVGARAAALSPCREALVIVFPPASHEHRAWRLAAVQELAREMAPRRVNGVVGADRQAIARTLAYLERAPGVTGQLLAVA